MQKEVSENQGGLFDTLEQKRSSRRRFFATAGTGALIATVIGGCSKVAEFIPGKYLPAHDTTTVDLGSGDTGILNYAYSLEQLEAEFYITVSTIPFYGMKDSERTLLKDIRDHEIAHREFFKKVLGKSAIPTLDLDLSSIDFTSRDSVLATAKAFEDLGVSAYNGAGTLISNPDYLTVAGRIVSVEARHAAYIRDLISYGSFADATVLDANGLDTSRTPAEVLPIAGKYIRTKIDASHLPTS